MTKDEAFLRAIIAQREQALNALAEAQAEITVLQEQLKPKRAKKVPKD